MTDRLINKLASDIAEQIYPSFKAPDGCTMVSGRKMEIEQLLIDFANEIKRQAVEP